MGTSSSRGRRAYVAAVSIVGVGAIATVMARGVDDWSAFAVFALLALGAELGSVRLPNGATASAVLIPVMAAVHVLGADGAYLAGGVVAAAGGLYLPDLRERRYERIAFNTAQLGLAGLAAAGVYSVFDPAAHQSALRLVGATFPAGLTFLLVNVALVSPMLAVDRDRRLASVLGSFRPYLTQYVPFTLVGTGMGWIVGLGGLAMAVFVVVPVVVARQIFATFLALRAAQRSTLRILVRALERKDPYTAGHVDRVATYARYIGEELRLSAGRQERLEYAALMHDVGKLVVSNHLLTKPDRLTPGEYERVQLHEAVSVELLRRIDFLRPIATSASPRFARYDARRGPGPIEPYIVVVADAYDAMTSTRSYRRALPQHVAFAELRRHAGTQFHPDCVDALIRALERREERHGAGVEGEVVLFDEPPPRRGPGSAGLGDLAPDRHDASLRPTSR